MGYNTDYSLTSYEQPPAATCAHCQQQMPGWRSFEDAIREIADYDVFGGDAVKWYEHEAEIARAMIETGTASVVVHGEGEEQGDVWDKTFTLKDGVVTVETVKYELKPKPTASKQVAVLTPKKGRR